MAEIIWLASYPKSGNTWFRSFISNLLSEKDNPVNINAMLTDGIASSRGIFDDWAGIEASDLTFDEIDLIRPDIYKRMIDEAKRNLYIKVHDAYTYLPDSRPLFPGHRAKAIYLIRNPLDVAVSFSYHAASTLEQTIAGMNDPEFAFCAGSTRLHNQLRQKLLSRSSHVQSWADNGHIPVEVIRYEDMKSHPLETFKRAVDFIGLDYDDQQIYKAIQFSDFKVLKQQEEKDPFKERPPQAESFFRQGNSGDWTNHLSYAQINNIIATHKEIMQRFGYLNKKGEILP
ncbi:MAG TPA: sulfotransferase domain-containing protein [Syntrophomonadaceae bacterium]|nr:sulfotransferase domain-containing protein [Syntrophomonadaceae bacterium]